MIQQFKSLKVISLLFKDPRRNPAGERERRILLTVLASVSSKGISIATQLISIPLTVNYLGTERYGLWVTISSLILLLSFADLGLGNGLLNRISQAYGTKDRDLARTSFSSAFFMLAGVAICVSAVLLVSWASINWIAIFNVKTSQARADVGPSVAVFLCLIGVSLPLGVIQRTNLGFQEGYFNGLWTALGNVFGLGGVLLVIWREAPLPWLVLSLAGGPVLGLLINAIHLLVRRPWLIPRFSKVRKDESYQLLRTGLLFFLIQLCAVVGFQSDNLIIAQMLGASSVTEFSLVYKLFGFVPVIVGMVLAPLWPAYGEAIARGDVPWILSAIRKSIVLTLAFSALAAIVLYCTGGSILDGWIGDGGVAPSRSMLVGFSVWVVLFTTLTPIAAFLNGGNILKLQAGIGCLMIAINIPASIMLIRFMGISGAVWGTVASLVIAWAAWLTAIPKVLSNMVARASIKS